MRIQFKERAPLPADLPLLTLRKLQSTDNKSSSVFVVPLPRVSQSQCGRRGSAKVNKDYCAQVNLTGEGGLEFLK